MRTTPALTLAALWVTGSPPLAALERLEPAEGCYFGVNLGEEDTVDRLSSRLGLTPAVHVQFFHFPLTPPLRAKLAGFLDQVRASHGIALITLEPFQGLSAVSEADCHDLANLCAAQENQGIGGILIRFAHEMNGNWYPWCQQPLQFKETFRLLATAIHPGTTRTAMLWAPHNGIGYPFSVHGPYQAAPGSPDFAALDTNGDGVLTAQDDMYHPYYPGDDVVDWVGMTLYHWGVTYPWLENEMPPPNSFASTLRGAGHEPPIPDFYARYCADAIHHKPLAIPETAALFNPQQPAGPGEFPLKQAWWRQVFNASEANTNDANIAVEFPKLKCISWFDHYKAEAEAQDQWIDWRISSHPALRQAFVEHLRAPFQGRPYFLTASEFACAQRPDCLTASFVPAIVPLTGVITVGLNVRARTNCDLVVDLLDTGYQWRGGTRAAVTGGTHVVWASLQPSQPLLDGATYRWSIFLTPAGSNHQSALAWHIGPGPVARAMTPRLKIVGYPPVVPAGSNFTVKVHYTAAADFAVVQANLLDDAYRWHGGGTAPVRRGDGLVDVLLSPQPTFTNGTYLLECFLSDSPTNWQQVMARSPTCAIQAAASMRKDVIQTSPQPSLLPAGEVFRFLVSYAAADTRDLHIDLFDADTRFIAGNVQRVGASSGIQEMTLSHPDAAPGSYFVRSFLTEPGQTWTQALAWSAVRQLTVLPASYWQWAEWRWGVLLDSDSILPDQDADGDGANNDAERIAHTSPLDPAQVLRLEASVDAGRLALRWASAEGRQYQLFEAAELSGNNWTPLGGTQDGTGGVLQVAVDRPAANLRRFYRIQVSVP